MTVHIIYNSGNNSSSAVVDDLLGTISVSPTMQYFSLSTATIEPTTGFLGFRPNAVSIGSSTTDTISISIRGPSSTWNIQVTDFSLIAGDVNVTFFPPQTNAEMLSEGVAGWMPTPDPNGQDLYLPLILTPTGMIFDHSEVGQIISKTETTATGNELPLFGNTLTYIFSNFSTLGIPYSRLGNYLITNSPVANTPMFGTGLNYATAGVVNAQPTEFYLIMNTSGGVTAPTGSISPASNITFTGSDPTYTGTVASVPASGSYITFVTNPSSPISYYAWFNTGASTDPAPGGIGIQVNIAGLVTAAAVVTAIIKAINSYQFALPNLAGYALRALDTGGTLDKNFASRTTSLFSNTGSSLAGAFLGSLEAAYFASHNHVASITQSQVVSTEGSPRAVYVDGGGSSTGLLLNTTTTTGTHFLQVAPPVTVNATGGGAVSTGNTTDTTPYNFAVNYFIKY